MKAKLFLAAAVMLLCGASAAQATTIAPSPVSLAVPTGYVTSFDYSFTASSDLRGSARLTVYAGEKKDTINLFTGNSETGNLLGTGSVTWQGLVISYQDIVSTANGLSGLLTITNTTGSNSHIKLDYSISTAGNFTSNSYHYNQTAVSAVPLPAALPLFGLGLLGLGAVRRKKN